jgi:hypothetical protein
LQIGVPPEQSTSARHWTQLKLLSRHFGVAGLLAAQVVSEVHCLQVLLATSQSGVPPLHVVLSTHWTHRLLVRLHAGVAPLQSPPAVQPHAPVTHALLFACPAQLRHEVPHDPASVLDAQVVPVQQLPVEQVPVPGP